MKDISSTTFGYLIGFLLPGLVCIYGLGYVSSEAQHLLQPARQPDATIGPSLLLLLGAVLLGMILSVIRFLTFEKLLCRKYKFKEGLFRKLVDEQRLVLFKSVVDEHYRYHQFSGGFALAFVVLFVGWSLARYASMTRGQYAFLLAGFFVLEAVMIYSAVDSYRKYVDRGNSLIE